MIRAFKYKVSMPIAGSDLGVKKCQKTIQK